MFSSACSSENVASIYIPGGAGVLWKTVTDRLGLIMIRRIARKIISLIYKKPNYFDANFLNTLSSDEVYSLVLHDCHRIEKAHYNDIFNDKKDYYDRLLCRVQTNLAILEKRQALPNGSSPSTQWIQRIVQEYDSLETSFIQPMSLERRAFDVVKVKDSLDLFRQRRSCRVWDQQQPSQEELFSIGIMLVDCARWAPNSGNRQAWRFALVADKDEKRLLKGLKEEHCYNAPLLIFVGMDSRLYKASGHLDDCMFLDAGAAISQMIQAAHSAGLGTCWNHLGKDLVNSRPQNKKAYELFCQKIGIPEFVTPAGLLAIGIPAFLPPVPERLEVSKLVVNWKNLPIQVQALSGHE
ncbi:MAG: nitroreductase family protein [Caldilineaceae bacterium]|nr:nitroreductase family protein [Caldilineaceae bacterium]